MERRRFLGCVSSLLLVLVVVQDVGLAQRPDALPARLTDAEFWRLTQAFSEPGGYFRTDNLLSNELYFPDVLDALTARVKAGGVYLGVGPEQNFHYIAALRPRIAFITDIRRGNLHLQLMYKALFELSTDRAEFVSRLFTKPRPSGLSAASTAEALMQAFWEVPSSGQPVFDANVAAVIEHLTRTHAFPLPAEDVEGIRSVYHAFYWFGPSITYSSSQGNGGRGGRTMANYAELMTATGSNGEERSFLASEDAFRFVRDLERRNLIVPVVGDFAGPHALRSVGAYIRAHGETVGAFYLSNVEQYLRQDGIWNRFCANVALMPLSDASTFIRSQSAGRGSGFRNELGLMLVETAGCAPVAEAER